MRTLVASLLAGLFTVAVPAQDVWVDPINGVDTNPGTAAFPVKTLTQAHGMAGINSRSILKI